jgi:hypothetical protein
MEDAREIGDRTGKVVSAGDHDRAVRADAAPTPGAASPPAARSVIESQAPTAPFSAYALSGYTTMIGIGSHLI